MAGLSNKEIAAVFKEIEILMRVLGEDAGRATGYGRVSLAIKNLPDSAADLAAAGNLVKVKGIGPKIQAAVAEIVDTGTCVLRDDLYDRLPPGVPEILQVPGLGPKRVHTVLKELGVESLEELAEAALDGRVAELPGFGKKSAEKILEGIAFLNETRGRRRLAAAWAIGRMHAERLGLDEFELAGSLRRGEKTIHTISIVGVGAPGDIDPPDGARREDGVWIVPRGREPELRIRLVDRAAYARAVFEETGPPEHVASVLARDGTDATEDEIYTSRGLHVVPPERRHACDGTQPVSPLVSRADLQGLVHAHTDWSDGTATLAEMADAAAERGYSYLTVTDHSEIAVYANGLTPERLAEQGRTIDAFNAEGHPVRVLKGTEVDILPDGTLDYPDDVLATLDVVIASIHSTFTQSAEKITERVLAAVRHPHVHILGHPTGRLLLRRGPYAVDMERVLEAAAESRTAIELNASPWRLDLDPDLHARAQELGVLVPICPDAHAPAGMDDVDWGVLAARHGGLRPDDVPNARDADGFLEALRCEQWAKTVIRRLRGEYPDAECALHHDNAYELAVATILSAQCTDEMVNQVTPELFKRWPTPEKLARARRATVERVVHSTGFYRNKAKNIQGMAKRLVEEFDGAMPRTLDRLLTLPGVARKTGNVILGVAFGIAEGVVVDTHVKRIAKRLGLTDHDDPVKVEKDLMALLSKDDWIDVSHLMIWHGRRVCSARKPKCGDCVLNDRCPAREEFA